jgi:autotransporter strand-loop-strand O-heptosyltransferase
MVKRNYTPEELVKYKENNPNITNFENKTLLIHLDSFCLGDTICFSSFLDSFVEYHNPEFCYVTTFFPHLLESTNPKYKFVGATEEVFLEIDKLINVGYDKDNTYHTINGMQYAAKDTLFLPPNTQIGKPHVIKKDRVVKHNKITIGPESLKKIATWEKEKWQEVVDKIVMSNFEVYNVSYENTLELKNVIGIHGNDDINVSLSHILESRVFIGLSSGLAWLAWAYDVPVVMIANFTKVQNEFDCFRVWTPYVCHGCFNTYNNISSSCPLFKGTNRENECHKVITSEMVIDKVNQALSFTKII